MSLPENNEIQGVLIKPIKSFPDGRGFFREVFRHNEEVFDDGKFAQWSHSKMQKNVVKAWHFHHKQTDWWYVPIGQVEVILYDNREESPTYQKKLVFKLGNADKYKDIHEACVRIPPGVLHACQVLSEEAHLFYITSEIYDAEDEGRIPYNSPEIPHEWNSQPIVSERDCLAHTPSYKRTQ